MNSSYTSTIDFGTVIKSLTFIKQPTRIVEFGILNGYSLQCFIDSSDNKCNISAFDIFDEFKGNHASTEIIDKFKQYPNVEIRYGDFYTQHLNIEDNSIDILHVDIANNGDVLEFVLEKYMKKISSDGIILFEGGSVDRDNVEWMDKYSKPKINPVIERNKDKFLFHTIGDFPSLTVIKTKI